MAIAIGLLLIAIHGSSGEQLLSPGPLTFQHAAVGGCSTCHLSAAEGPSGWLTVAFGLGTPQDGDHACHACHDLGATPADPHSQPASRMAALTRVAATADRPSGWEPVELTLSSRLFGRSGQAVAAAGCASCHREHRGVDAHLTALPDAACQTCHAVRFASLSDGHPEFGGIGLERRPRIRFDHGSHLERHFLETAVKDAAPGNCSGCHRPSENRRVMATRPFEAMCGSCHAGDISGAALAGRKGVPVLTVPGIDVRELEARGVDIGDWPQWSDEPVTPFMRLMLERDREAAEALQSLRNTDLLDLRQASPGQVRAAATVAFSVKRLYGDLIEGGADAAARRLAAVVRDDAGGPDRDMARVGTLLGHMPAEVLQAAARDWFPRLGDELQARLPSLPEPIPGPAAETDDRAGPGGSSPLDQSDILAPPAGTGSLLTDQSDILAPPADTGSLPPDQSDILAPPAGTGSLPPDQSDILAPPADAGSLLTDQSDILAPPADAGSLPPDQSDILAPPAGTGSLLTDQSDILAPPADTGSLLTDRSDILSVPGGPAPLAMPTPPVAVAEAESPPALPVEVEPSVDPESWMAGGGWYRENAALLYRPTGHADGFLRSWIDVAAAMPGDWLASFRSGDAPGKCLKCHSVDSGPATDRRAPAVNWLGARQDPARREFTAFSHEPHFTVVGEAGCQTCHALAAPGGSGATTAFMDQYAGDDPAEGVVADFSKPQRETCAGCHTRERAGDACTQCHAYHVGRFEAPTLPTVMGRPSAPR